MHRSGHSLCMTHAKCDSSGGPPKELTFAFQLLHFDLQRSVPQNGRVHLHVIDTNKEKWGKKNGPVFRKVCVFDVSRATGIARFESVSESQPHRTIQCH